MPLLYAVYTDLNKTGHQDKIPGNVVMYYFWYKFEIDTSIKPKDLMLNSFNTKYLEMV